MWCRSQKCLKRLKIQFLAGAAALFLGIPAIAQSNSIPLFQFAIFYNSLLEFTWCPPMNINGRVHANGDIYTGSAWQLTFNDSVSLTGAVASPPWGGHNVSEYRVPTAFKASRTTNTSALTLNTGLPNSPTALREIINMPPPGEDPNSLIGQQRYFNKAKVVLIVTDSNITATVKTSATDPAPSVITAAYYPTNNSWTNYINIANSFPFLSHTNYWPTNPVPCTDLRENATLKLTDINVAVFKRWLITNDILNSKFPNVGGVYASPVDAPNILYVADNRSYTNHQLTALRLGTAQIIPTNLFVFNGSNVPSGFTLATPNPLYLYGNYNVPENAGLGSTNTAMAKAYPASLVADAITTLSSNWKDSLSGSFPISSKTPTDTTINAAIVAGIVYSTGSADTNFSGGVQNLPRLLEDWSTATTLTINGSLVNLFPSVRATNRYEKPGIYYNAPTRWFSFDPNFLQAWKLPPGTPMVGPTVPAITSQPTNQGTTESQTISFTQSHTGLEPMSYQWYVNGTNALVSATTAKLTLTNVQPTDAGDYSVVISNACGIVTSQPASLTVYVAPSITPLQNLAVVVGQNASWTPTASGTDPLAFQWQFNGSDIIDAKAVSLILTNVASDQAGTYSLIVSNVAGSITNSATLSVYTTAAATLSLAPAFSPDHFQFTVTGVPGFSYVIEASTNFFDWEPLFTNTSPFTLTDDQTTNHPARFYRSVYTLQP